MAIVMAFLNCYGIPNLLVAFVYMKFISCHSCLMTLYICFMMIAKKHKTNSCLFTPFNNVYNCHNISYKLMHVR